MLMTPEERASMICMDGSMVYTEEVRIREEIADAIRADRVAVEADRESRCESWLRAQVTS